MVGFSWDPEGPGWVRPELPVLSHLAGPYQRFKAAFLDIWKAKVCFDLCRQGFRRGLILTLLDPFSSYMQRVLEKKTRLCSEASWWHVCGMDFFSVMPGEESFRAGSEEVSMGMGISFGSVLTPLWFKFVKFQNFTI